MRILLIEDDRFVSKLVVDSLKKEGYAVDSADNASSGLEIFRINSDAYQVIILDLILPDLNGFEVLKEIRSMGFDTPVLILSSKDSVDDKVKGLDIGGDDYLTKPFDVKELIARVHTLQRRKNKAIHSDLTVGDIRLHTGSQEVFVQDEIVKLTNIEYRILYLLIENLGKLISRDEILEKVWDIRGDLLMSNTINVHMKNLRKKLEFKTNNPQIQTVRGRGYMLSVS